MAGTDWGRDQLSIGDHQGALGTLFISTGVPSNSQVHHFIPYCHSKSRMNLMYRHLGWPENTPLHFQRKINRDLTPCTLNGVSEHKIQLDLHYSNVMMSNKWCIILKQSNVFIRMPLNVSFMFSISHMFNSLDSLTIIHTHNNSF